MFEVEWFLMRNNTRKCSILIWRPDVEFPHSILLALFKEIWKNLRFVDITRSAWLVSMIILVQSHICKSFTVVTKAGILLSLKEFTLWAQFLTCIFWSLFFAIELLAEMLHQMECNSDVMFNLKKETQSKQSHRREGLWGDEKNVERN